MNLGMRMSANRTVMVGGEGPFGPSLKRQQRIFEQICHFEFASFLVEFCKPNNYFKRYGHSRFADIKVFVGYVIHARSGNEFVSSISLLRKIVFSP